MGSVPSESPAQFTLTSLTPGADYSIAVVAENIHGAGPQSETIIVRAADQPDKPYPITTFETYTFIELQWSTPFDNYFTLTELKT